MSSFDTAAYYSTAVATTQPEPATTQGTVGALRAVFDWNTSPSLDIADWSDSYESESESESEASWSYHSEADDELSEDEYPWSSEDEYSSEEEFSSEDDSEVGTPVGSDNEPAIVYEEYPSSDE